MGIPRHMVGPHPNDISWDANSGSLWNLSGSNCEAFLNIRSEFPIPYTTMMISNRLNKFCHHNCTLLHTVCHDERSLVYMIPSDVTVLTCNVWEGERGCRANSHGLFYHTIEIRQLILVLLVQKLDTKEMKVKWKQEEDRKTIYESRLKKQKK